MSTDQAVFDLIRRMEAALKSEQERPLWLHWSDVTLLKAIAIEQGAQTSKLEALKATLSKTIDELIRRAA